MNWSYPNVCCNMIIITNGKRWRMNGIFINLYITTMKMKDENQYTNELFWSSYTRDEWIQTKEWDFDG